MDHFLVLFRSPKSASGFPSPEQLEASSLLADKCFGLEDDQKVSRIGPNPHKKKPKISVGPAEPGPAWLPFEHHELMAQSQDFEGKIVPASEERKWVCQNDPKSGQYNSPKPIANPRQSIISRPDGLSATHRCLLFPRITSRLERSPGSCWRRLPASRPQAPGTAGRHSDSAFVR